MNKYQKILGNSLLVPFLLTVILFGVLWYLGSSLAYEWVLINKAIPKDVQINPFSMGLFSFLIEGKVYGVTQLFSSQIREWPQWIFVTSFFLVWLCFTGLLAMSVRAKNYIFYIAIFTTIMTVAFFGLDSNAIDISKRTDTLILLLMLVVPAYYFQAFATKWSWWKVWLVLFLLSAFPLVIWLYSESYGIFQLISGSYYLSAGFVLFFLFLFAEEPVFLILRLISSTKSSSNAIHFIVLSLLYLGTILLFYLARSGYVDSRWMLFDPFILFMGLLAITFFTIDSKQSFAIENFKSEVSIRALLLLLLLGVIGNVALGAVIQNDSAYQIINYSSLYFLLGMGFLFLIYIIANFINPLAKGLPIYKIAYKERNMPYSTAKLGGIVVVLAFFFLSGGEVYKLMQGARLGYESEHFRKSKPEYAKQLLEQSAFIAANNSFAQYRLGIYYELKNKGEEALGKFSLATKRYPTPYAYIKVAEYFSQKEDHVRAVTILREALYHFPQSLPVLTNLSVELMETGSVEEAAQLMRLGSKRIIGNSLPIKANLALLTGQVSGNTPLEVSNRLYTGSLPELGAEFTSSNVKFPLEIKGYSYIINHLLFLENSDLETIAIRALDSLNNTRLHQDLNMNIALSLYNRREVYQSINRFESMAQQTSDPWVKAKCTYAIGLIQLKERAYASVLTTLESLDPTVFPQILPLKLAAYLESGQFEDAKMFVNQWDILADYRPMLHSIFSNDSSDFASFYYNCLNYSIEEFITLKNRFPRELAEQAEEKYLFDNLNAAKLKLVMAFLVRSNTTKYLKIQEEVSGEKAPDFRNPYTPWSFVFALNTNDSTTTEEYNKLTEMMYRNPQNILLLQSYCLEALEQGLVNYAENALAALYFLMPEDERFVFERKYQDIYDLKRQKSFSTIF